MQTRSWVLLAVLGVFAGCGGPQSGESDEASADGWTPDDDADIGPVYLLVSEEREDNPPYSETTSARVQVFDVSQPGGGGEHATVLETLVDIKYPVLSPSHRWAAIATGLQNYEPFYDVYLIDFVGSPLEPARPIERPSGNLYDFWFAADDSGLVFSLVSFDGYRNHLYYVPLLESGPLQSLEVEMPDEREASSSVGLSEDGRWLVFTAHDDVDDVVGGLYVSEIIGGQPSLAQLVQDVGPPFQLGGQFHVAGGAVIFSTYESVGAEGEEPSLHRLHRIDLETLEVRNMTLGEPEAQSWRASADGSRVLYVRGPSGGQVVDYIEIADGEPQPAVTLGLGDSEAQASWAKFLAGDGRYAVARVYTHESDSYSYSYAWYDFEGPNPTEPVGIEIVGHFGESAGTWAASATPDGSVLLINPSLGFADVVELPPPWHATHLSVYGKNTRVVIQALEGPPSDPSDPAGEPSDGVWTLRTTDEPGPPVRFDHPLEADQHLPLHFNVLHVPTSERHYYQVIDGNVIQSVYDVERRTIWENDGLGGRTVMTELEGDEFAHLVVAPGE